MNLNVDLVEESVSQINGRIVINTDASVIIVMYLKKIMFGIQQHVIVKMEKKLASIMDDSTIICNEVIELKDEKIKTIPKTLMKEKQPVTRKIAIFYLHF